MSPSSVLRGTVGLAASASLLGTADAKNAFVLNGATGDNALRPAGIWAGLFEAWSGGVFSEDTYSLHVAMNAPHTVDELQKKITDSLTPLYEELKQNKAWVCKAKGGDCDPQRLIDMVQTNIWKGRDPNEQAADMAASLKDADKITMYLSLPPFVFGSWTKAAVANWANGDASRLHIVVEKPFGTSVENAGTLYNTIIGSGLPSQNLHLADHWLSFFVNRHLPDFRGIVEKALGIEFSDKDIENVIVTEFETRGLEGRGEFFNGVGQVRDMVQSHLLQVLSLVLLDPTTTDRSVGKLEIFNNTNLLTCKLSQYDGFLLEPKLSYHGSFADSTLCNIAFQVKMPQWTRTGMDIQTGKDMGTTLYTVELIQRGGKGKVTYSIGKEETGVAGINVTNWPLKDASSFDIPRPGFGSQTTRSVTPNVDASGNGVLFQYLDEDYFPKPYANMLASLLTFQYGTAFVSYPECQRSWEIVNATRGACLDPTPEVVQVYKPPATCGHTAPRICYEEKTVADLYTKDFACDATHDKSYANISLYQAKCHPKVQQAQQTNTVIVV